ncbi:MAG: hypothetical protein C0623_07950 [Desulfuromonas sp.]|nr:MAG: hypothetical protein C0623_07950 [Desulfuromonas sp.]
MQKEIATLSCVIDMLRRQVNKDLPSQHIALLLAVAQKPGITMPELCKQLEMPQGTVSRNVKLLTHFCAKNGGGSVTRKGYGLLETEKSSANRYQLAVFLTNKGKELVEELARVMADEEAEGFRGRVVGKTVAMRKQALS